MKNITLTRNGQTAPRDEEVSTMHADGLKVGDAVMLRIKGDSCYGKATQYKEYVVAEIKPTDRFGGKSSDVKFVRADKQAERGGAAVVPVKEQQAAPTEAQAAEALKGQYRIVVAAETAAFRERVKFGAMLLQWDAYLGECRGVGHKGDGLKGWLAENCPEIGYAAAQSYKEMARRAIMMLGGGAMASAALIGDTVVRPDGVTVEVNETTREGRERLFAECDSRRKLEQAWFDFAKKADHGGLAKSKTTSGGSGESISAEDSALVTWDEAMQPFMKKRGVFYSAAKLLPAIAAENFRNELKNLISVLDTRLRG